MPYNPNVHHRKSIRLRGYDYSQAGLYFITICVHDKKCLFGEIVGDEMILNDFGFIAHQEWYKLPERFANMELDVFQIMPNHVHGIIILTDAIVGTIPTVGMIARNNGDVVWAGLAPAHNNVVPDETRAGASPAPTKPKTIGDIVGAYKSLVANDCLEIFKQKNPADIMGKLWQRNYHEHIIRDEQSYQRIGEYVITNPSKWKDDKFYR